MEEDTQNYSPTVMFRGAPCSSNSLKSVHRWGLSILVSRWICYFLNIFKKNLLKDISPLYKYILDRPCIQTWNIENPIHKTFHKL